MISIFVKGCSGIRSRATYLVVRELQRFTLVLFALFLKQSVLHLSIRSNVSYWPCWNVFQIVNKAGVLEHVRLAVESCGRY